ncbi:glycosyltransferase family 2 protein [Candidatus Roizmanbacteria bacterium]|nr:glycosyltransferase family 2 protein [Candidatus Roizmanbacteria bacterium]
MNKILLSIVIPTYNSQNTIQTPLLSINNSQFKNFNRIEVILIDDKSKDRTLKKIKEIQSVLSYKLTVFQLKKHSGPAKARNYGVKKAKGDYILFLDSDVELAKSTLRYAYLLSEDNKIKAFTGIWHYRQKTDEFFPNFKAMRDWVYWFIEREKYARYYLFSTRIAGIEKKLFQKIGGFDEKFTQPTVEDIELTHRIEKHTKIRFSPELLIYHEFEDFLPIAIKYFKRARDWIGLYQKRLRFDPVTTSKKEAFKALLAGLLVITLILSAFHWIFLYIAIIIAIQFTNLEWYFWTFVLKQKGSIFLLKSIISSIILYLIIDLGSAWGLIISRLQKKGK